MKTRKKLSYLSLFIIVFLSIINCSKNKTPKKLPINKSEIPLKTTSLDFKDILQLTPQKAIEKYGIPIANSEFILHDAHGEFRNKITYAFTTEESRKENIQIIEFTWQKDSVKNITVWYHKNNQKEIAKDSLIWYRDSEF
ncbi:hypothetical protein [Tenacibaculum sp. M341]|uniref:hypothetical protein n=1 Tax=Tenacibaculum sp. M341 TaxID=2530339 RepID=UPI0010494657|nr:hypothetical protein [Tenacibaculum sp. M341]TCI93148.1 hypothetical protein EYW44_05895 [Tenacibaculum sp. M341]